MWAWTCGVALGQDLAGAGQPVLRLFERKAAFALVGFRAGVSGWRSAGSASYLPRGWPRGIAPGRMGCRGDSSIRYHCRAGRDYLRFGAGRISRRCGVKGYLGNGPDTFSPRAGAPGGVAPVGFDLCVGGHVGSLRVGWGARGFLHPVSSWRGAGIICESGRGRDFWRCGVRATWETVPDTFSPRAGAPVALRRLASICASVASSRRIAPGPEGCAGFLHPVLVVRTGRGLSAIGAGRDSWRFGVIARWETVPDTFSPTGCPPLAYHPPRMLSILDDARGGWVSVGPGIRREAGKWCTRVAGAGFLATQRDCSLGNGS